ncbi:MAG TPA: chemotaxis protein CheX, partial [Synergistaceae bacterium]|nr:chemotaxis protein CheX [Synergistaceae bacterium]
MPVEKEVLKRLTTLVNSFGLSMIAVCEKLSISVSFNKGGVCVGVNAPGSRVATLISLYGEGAHGTLSIFMSEKCFASFVHTMTGGMIAPDPEDPV